MSLKAKLEAVIYAAEEPVTLAQLSAIFADEAFEWKAEQEAALAAAEGVAEAVPLPLDEDAEPAAGSESAPVVAAEVYAEEAETEPAEGAEAEVAPPTAIVQAEAPAVEAAAEAETAPQSAEELELEAKRQARQREREARAILRQLLDEIIASYQNDDYGVEIREIAGGYRMATKPECHDAVRLFIKSLKPAMKLSLPALETLAVIAYKQPITAPEVNEIRGVDSSGVFGSLLARKLIATAGRKQVIGRPILYKTTREFLMRFGLKDLSELPSMEEFEKLAVSELEDTESANDAAAEGTADMAEPTNETAQNPRDGEPEGADSDPTAAPETADSSPAQETVPESEAPVSEPQPEAAPTDGTVEDAAIATEEAEPDAPAPTQQAETEIYQHDHEEDNHQEESGHDQGQDARQGDDSQEEDR